MQRTFRVGVLVAGLVLAASACGGGDDGAGGTTTSAVATTATTVASTTTSVEPGSPEDEAAVLAALDRYWAARERAQQVPDPNHPDLVAVARGDALSRAQDAIREVELKGWTRRSKSGVQLNHGKVMKIAGNGAEAWECVIDDGVVYDSAGVVAVPEQVWSYTFHTLLERSPNGWIVVARTLSAQREGRTLCPMLPQQ